MNNLPRLNTRLIADQVKDHLVDLKDQELITPAQYKKSASFRRVLDAINSADMDACRIIKQEVQMVILVPQGTDEVLLESAPSFIDPTTDSDFLADVESETVDANIQTNQVFLNREWFVDASQIRSQYLHAYSKFPKGNTSPAYKLKLVRQEMFDDSKMKGYYDDHAWGELSVVLYEPATKRLRFGKSFSQDTFISFPAYMMAAKLDLQEIHNGDWNAYKIKSPTYAEKYVVFNALEEALPIASQAQQYMEQKVAREQQKLYQHIPQNTSAIEVTDGYIG